MVKHRLRESIKSLFRSHIDPEKREQLKGAKREIQHKVKRILKLVKDEHVEEDGTPSQLSKKESLVKLVEDFHNQYQSLDAKYDHLTDELRKNIIGKQKQGSFSSSCDSDSDYSTTEKDSKKGQFENEFQKKINGMKQELEMGHVEVAELDRKLTITREEKEDLNSRYLAALDKIQAADKIIMDLKANFEALSIQRSGLLEENVKLNKQLTIAVKSEAELNQRLEDLKRKTDNLILEKETVLLHIDEGQKIIDSLRTMADQQKDEKISVQKELEAVAGQLCFLKQQLEHAELQMTNLSHSLKVTEEENESMELRLLRLSNEVQMADNRTEERIAESNQLREELHDRERQVSALTRMHEEYENESSNQVKALEFQVRNLKLELESLQSLKRDQIHVLQQEVKFLNHQKSDLEIQLEGKVLENSGYVIQIQTLIEEVDSISLEQKRLREDKENSIMQIRNLESEMTEASAQIMAFTAQVDNLQDDLLSLEKEREELILHCERVKEAHAESLVMLENELASKTLGHNRTLEEREDAYQKLNEDFKECKVKLEVADKKMEEMTEDFHKGIDSREQRAADLEQAVEDLKRGLEEKGDEIVTLLENVRMVEVKLRQSNQKLRVTEQLLSEQGESFRETVGKFQKDQRSPEDSIATLSATIAAKDNAYQEILTVIKESVNNVMTGIENVVCKFSAEYKHYENCISNILHELQIAKNYVREMNKEKERSKKDIHHLGEQLQHKNEQELTLRKMVEKLEEKASKEELDKKNLTTTVVKLQKTVGELEKLMKEKDEGILDMGEEKKEAIRQLCLGIDYHRNRYEYLKDVLSMTRRGQRAKINPGNFFLIK